MAKLPRPSVADDVHRLLSLRDEGRALRRLVAPAVPRYLETILSGEHPHLLLEYVPGPTLRTVLAGRERCRLGWWRDWDATWRAAWTSVNAVPRLLDFELARPVESAAGMLAPSGTWQYMAPEQRAAGLPCGAPIGAPAAA